MRVLNRPSSISRPKLPSTIRRHAGAHEYRVSCLKKRGFDLVTVLFVKGDGLRLHHVDGSMVAHFSRGFVDDEFTHGAEGFKLRVGEPHRNAPTL